MNDYFYNVSILSYYKIMNKIFLILLLPFICQIVTAQEDECTIGVACGTATEDGRPLLWKTRDYLSEPVNQVQYIAGSEYNFIAVTNDGESTLPWMGVNEHGFAIINSSSTDLPGGSSSGPGNGTFMKMALGSCKTVNDMQQLLDDTNISGRTTKANFGVIDSTGAAAIFETGHSYYWKYDAADATNGYVIRTNFAFNGGGSGGSERYDRSCVIINNLYEGDSLNYKNILRYQMRDFSDAESEMVVIPFNQSYNGHPFGYIEANLSICRNTSVSASVIQGTLPDEDARLATMWTILGQPGTSIAIPYWPIGRTPPEATGRPYSDLGNISDMIRDQLFDLPDQATCIDTYKLINGEGEGLWTKTFPYEDTLFARVGRLMEDWREESSFPLAEMAYTQDTTASGTYKYLLSCYNYLVSGMVSVEYPDEYSFEPVKANVYPNPFTSKATLEYEISNPSDIVIEIYDLTGMKLESAAFKNMAPGSYNYILDDRGTIYPKGILILRIQVNDYSRYIKVINR